MAQDRQPPTAADYVITALSPALIMGLVGSLAFFLLEVGYQGQYTGRLAYTYINPDAPASMISSLSVVAFGCQVFDMCMTFLVGRLCLCARAPSLI